MTKKIHILFIILTLGLFVTPTMTYACGTKSTKTEKYCCKKQNNNNKDCCKKHKSNNNKQSNGCDGKCGHSSCSCSAAYHVFNLPFPAEIRMKTFFAEGKKLKFYYTKTRLSSGFYSIWIPPKIA